MTVAVRVWRGVLAGVSAGALAVAGLVVAGPAQVASAQENDVSGVVQAWGDDGFGQSTVPGDLGPVTDVAAGWRHSVALLADGTVEAWGLNDEGQSTVPDDLGEVTAVAAGGYFSMALLADGTVEAWGDNRFGQVDVPGDLGEVTAVAAGGYFSMALLEDGTVRAWGLNSERQLDVPGDLGEVTAVAAGLDHSVALLEDGTVRAWGLNSDGQSTVPGDLGEVTAVAAGLNHSVALLADGTVEAWGSNRYGQSTVPEDLGEVTAVAAGTVHNVALLADGTVEAWGHDFHGQSDVPDDLDRVVGVSAGDNHSLVIVRPGSETVVSAEPNPGVVGEPVELTASVSSDAGVALSGSVEFTADGEVVEGCAAVAVDAGEATCTAPGASSVGSFEVVAEYSGDAIHGGSSSAPFMLETVAADTSTGLTAEPADVVVGESVELTASVGVVAPGAGAVRGSVVFTDGDAELGEVDLEPADGGSVATMATSDLGVGTHELSTAYAGSENFNASSSDVVTVTVGKADQSITFEPLPDVEYGVEPFEVEASASSGLDVTFTAAGPCAVDGAVVSVSGVGECTVTAHQDGSETWAAAEPVARSFTISGAPADVQVSGWEHVYDGEPHGVEVTTDPEGLDVEVTYDGEVEEPAGAGSYEVVVEVTDPNYVVDPVIGTMVIAKADQQISLDAPESVTFGDGPFGVTASATSELPVTVTAAGACTIDGSTVTPSSAGECVLTAEQPGDDNWNPAPSVTHTVVVDPAPTTTVLDGPDDVTVVGNEATFTATVTAPEDTGVPAGSVTFTVDDGERIEVELDADGVAEWATSDLAVGDHTVTAEYAGQGDHAASSSEAVGHEVVTAELSLTGLPGEVMAGDEVTVDVTGFVPGEDIELVLHSDPITVATVTADAVGSGSATFAVPDVPAGEHRLVATGTDSDLSVEASTTVAEKPTPTPEPSPTPEPELPDTGSSLGPLGTIGLLLAGFGALGLLVARRRLAGGQVV